MDFVQSEDLGLNPDSSSLNSYVAFDLGQRANHQKLNYK